MCGACRRQQLATCVLHLTADRLAGLLQTCLTMVVLSGPAFARCALMPPHPLDHPPLMRRFSAEEAVAVDKDGRCIITGVLVQECTSSGDCSNTCSQVSPTGHAVHIFWRQSTHLQSG